jgi:predicted metal-binding membrane protein
MSGPSASTVAGLAGQSPATVGLWPRVRAPKLFLGVVGALVALSWLGLALWSWSPYARFLSHEEVGEVRAFSDDYASLLVFFVAAWTLMTVAMMLPTSLPLLAFFQSLVRTRPDRFSLVALLVTGYLSVWIAFAVAVHAGDQGVHAAVGHSGLLEENVWVIPAATFVVAGLYQFSSLKHACLTVCRSPVAFVMQSWRGSARRDALRLGLQHGVVCVGCCWALMLLMFAVGLGSIGWMLVLSAVIATEKNVPWGQRVSRPLGVLLLVAALALAVAGAVGGAA